MPRRTVLVALVVAVVAAACSDGGNRSAPPSTSQAEPSPTTTTLRVDDGVYRVAVLAPAEGAGAAIGGAVRRAVDLARAELTAEGGVLGQRVDVITTPEPADPAAAAGVVGDLTGAGVDAIVGPTSSSVALAAGPALAADRLLACSPTATADALSGLPDDGYLFRTIGSDAAEAVAMADSIERTGRGSVAIVHPDDDYGADYAAAVTRALPDDLPVVVTAGYDLASDDVRDVIRSVLANTPEVVAVIGTGATGVNVLSALLAADTDGKRPIVVSSGLRGVAASDLAAPGSSSAFDRISGVSPRATPFAPFQERLDAQSSSDPIAFAAQAYDCALLLALAAEDAGSTDPADAKEKVIELSKSGSPCRSFASCRELLAQDRNVNVEGASGSVNLNARGDVMNPTYDRFVLDDSGRDVTEDSLTVPAP